uniref:CONSTANS-like protein n=1 Tax=Kalanchoe fedtschenkoi TaxID=63787 RepID=A0A7N1A985_KALFE
MGILVEESCVKGYPVVGGGGGGGGLGVWPIAAKPCDVCKSASALLFCKPDSAFLCVACDTRIHAVNRLASRHERLWMCEVCEQVPASVTCKADAAALCVSCDADIHSANPLSRKHDRVQLVPFYESAESIIKKSSAANAAAASGNGTNNLVNFLVPGADEEEDQVDDVSWFLPPQKAAVAAVAAMNPSEGKAAGGEMFFSDFDHLLDFENPNQVYLNFKNNQHVGGSDSVVPVQIKPETVSKISSFDRCYDIDFCKSKLPFYNFDQSNNHSVSSSALDIGLVPDGGSASDISYSLGKHIKSGGGEAHGVDSSSSTQATQLTGLDREARVLRYREKRKNRRFEKTIRYASRKAYAETRPRIKGRFVKRAEPDLELDSLFNSGSIHFFEGYGVVPSY